MTTDQIVNKWRRHMLGLLADCYATRKQPPGELGMTMDRHIMIVEQMIRDIVADIAADPPRPIPEPGRAPGGAPKPGPKQQGPTT